MEYLSGNSEFEPYWSLRKPNLPKAIKGIFHILRKYLRILLKFNTGEFRYLQFQYFNFQVSLINPKECSWQFCALHYEVHPFLSCLKWHMQAYLTYLFQIVVNALKWKLFSPLCLIDDVQWDQGHVLACRSQFEKSCLASELKANQMTRSFNLRFRPFGSWWDLYLRQNYICVCIW
jgi:hypothetical protein